MHLRGRITVFAAAGALAVAALGQGCGRCGHCVALGRRPSTGPHSTPQWLAGAKHVGAVSTASAVNFRVYLAPRGGTAAVQRAVAAVSTPGSASYRKFMTPAGYHSAYDPSAATVASVRKWLASDGLKVRAVGEYNSYLQVTGTAAQAQKAFSTTIAKYRHDGMTVQANTTPLTVPTAVAASVLTVTGIDTTPSILKAQAVTAPAPPPAGFNNGRPCSQYYGQLIAKFQADYKTPLPKFQGKYLPYAVCGYTGLQFRAAYEGNTALDGTGVTVGIVDAYLSPTLYADANKYATEHGDGSYAKGQLKLSAPKTFTNQDLCAESGWYGEQTLDVEAVHAMAPGANILYYGSASCLDSDFLTTITKIVNQNKVQIVSNSYGEADEFVDAGSIAANEAVFMQGALQGISFVFSSGDSGDELANTAIKQTDSSASDPYVTAAGGTSTAIDVNASIAFQTGWGTQSYSLSSSNTWASAGFLYGAGGGYSNLFNRPSYQVGVVPASAPPGRAVPDVAMDADPNTGMLIGETQTFPDGVHYGEYRIGGTSLASPLFAGMTALLIQHAGGGLGFLNPLIYGQVKAGTFSDVKGKPTDAGNVRVNYANSIDPSGGLVYSVRTFNQDSSLTTTTGWDDVTGVGAPNPGWITSISPAK